MRWKPRRLRRGAGYIVFHLVLLATLAGVFVLVIPLGQRGAEEALRENLTRWVVWIRTQWNDKAPGVRAHPPLSGRAHVLDGDTLEVAGVRIRLYGIDAPESSQSCRAKGRPWSCGREATRALARRIGEKPVACEERDRDRYGRVVAVCRISRQELNAYMVAEGWAFAYRRYSRAYVAEESRARAAKRGVWRGEVVAPWDWRRGERLASSQRTVRPGGRQCDIKGNISSGGKRIYHVPGDRYYAQTRIEPSRGERWFCTEGEARGAGWRRSST